MFHVKHFLMELYIMVFNNYTIPITIRNVLKKCFHNRMQSAILKKPQLLKENIVE